MESKSPKIAPKPDFERWWRPRSAQERQKAKKRRPRAPQEKNKVSLDGTRRRDTRTPTEPKYFHYLSNIYTIFPSYFHLDTFSNTLVGSLKGPPRIVYASRVPPRRHRTLNGRLPLEHGSDRHETSAKRVSDDLQLSIFWRRKTNFSAELRQNAFQTICNFRFFDTDKIFWQKISVKNFGSENVFRYFRQIL